MQTLKSITLKTINASTLKKDPIQKNPNWPCRQQTNLIITNWRDHKILTKAPNKTSPLKNTPISPCQTIKSHSENNPLIRLKNNTKTMTNLQTNLNKTIKALLLAVIQINLRKNGAKMKNLKFLPPKCSVIWSQVLQFFKVEVLE